MLTSAKASVSAMDHVITLLDPTLVHVTVDMHWADLTVTVGDVDKHEFTIPEKRILVVNSEDLLVIAQRKGTISTLLQSLTLYPKCVRRRCVCPQYVCHQYVCINMYAINMYTINMYTINMYTLQPNVNIWFQW